jgi:hypothetical protein
LAPEPNPEDGDTIVEFSGDRGPDQVEVEYATQGRLRGGAGDDRLVIDGVAEGYGIDFVGGPGRDWMVGGYTNVLDMTGEGDTVIGDGINVSYTRAPSGVRVSLRRERGYRIDGSGAADKIIGHISVFGSPFDDVMIGTDYYHDHMFGRQGDDRLLGLGGNDVLVGGGGDDWVDGGAPEPTVGGEDPDLVYGNAGYDVCLNGHVQTDGDADCEITTAP